MILVLLDAFNWVYVFATAHQDYHIDKIVMLYFPLSLMSIWGASLQFRRKRELIKSYYVDKLTGVPNRVAFRKDFANRENDILVMINIIDFKMVNKTLGLKEGDEFLKRAILHIQKLVDDEFGEAIYRLYGDELGFFVSFKHKENVKEKCKTIQHDFQKTSISTMDIEINLDINIAYSDTTPLFQTTMMAMEKARNAPNNEIMKYLKSMNDTTVSAQNILMLKIIKRAIKQDLMVPYYQALIDNKTGKVCKYEALVRIKDINGRIISPIEFLTISKRVKLYPAITKIVVEKSFETFKDRPEMFSVNLSYGDISNCETMEFFRGVLKANPETAKRLTVEILETEDIQDYANLLSFYRDIQKYGCKLAIDDFGAGYSNVMHVLMLKPDYIKIDGSLIKDILASDENQTFVKSIISFSKKYGIKTVAEFVATKELAEYVSEIGIDISQGYHYAQPVEILPEIDIAK